MINCASFARGRERERKIWHLIKPNWIELNGHVSWFDARQPIIPQSFLAFSSIYSSFIHAIKRAIDFAQQYANVSELSTILQMNEISSANKCVRL